MCLLHGSFMDHISHTKVFQSALHCVMVKTAKTVLKHINKSMQHVVLETYIIKINDKFNV